MFSKDLELTIGQCYKEAREQRHEFMTVEHLLLALLENPSAAAVLRARNSRRESSLYSGQAWQSGSCL